MSSRTFVVRLLRNHWPVAVVFISHQKQDAAIAAQVAQRLNLRHVDTYLDVLDAALMGTGEDLTAYLRAQLGKCDHLIAVVSPATQASWWVPFEIGLATERAYPIATFAQGPARLPDYLEKWPHLRTVLDLDTYARVLGEAQRRVLGSKALDASLQSERRSYANTVQADLRAALR